MKLKQKKDGNNLIINFEELNNKQLDLSHITELRTKFKKIIIKDVDKFILDFITVDYIDSAVIGFIVDMFNTIRADKKNFQLINVNRNVFEILDMINLTKFLDIRKR